MILYRRAISMILLGIGFINIVQLIGNNIDSIFYILINLTLWLLLILFVLKKHYVIRMVNPFMLELALHTISVFFVYNYVVYIIIENYWLLDSLSFYLSLLSSLLLNISLFFEVTD